MTALLELAEKGAALKRRIAAAPDDADAVRLRQELDAVAAEIEHTWSAQDVVIESWSAERIAKAKREDLADDLARVLLMGTDGHVAVGPHFGHRLISYIATRKGH